MLQILTRFICAALFAATIFVPVLAQEGSSEEALKILPERVGEFRARVGQSPRPISVDPLMLEGFSVVSVGWREYVSASGKSRSVGVVKTDSASTAHSLLTSAVGEQAGSYRFRVIDGLGFAGNTIEIQSIKFIKGDSVIYVHITSLEEVRIGLEDVEFAQQLASTIDGEVGEVPVLMRHLPNIQRFDATTGYAVSLQGLKAFLSYHSHHEGPLLHPPVLDVISFEGGTEAAVGYYDTGKLVIVEFSTPQYAVENDARIQQRIAELRAAGQPVPSAYRREGNYSVFVFDAPDEAAAAGLIEQVKYEKDVRWLGDNPRVGERVERLYRTTMTGVLVTTLKATGLAIIICLGIGGIFGGAVFFYRRTRPAAKEAFTDAGGMMRLDIEDVNAPRDSSKLLGEAAKQYRER